MHVCLRVKNPLFKCIGEQFQNGGCKFKLVLVRKKPVVSIYV